MRQVWPPAQYPGDIIGSARIFDVLLAGYVVMLIGVLFKRV